MYLRQARYIAKIWDLDIEYRQGDAHQLPAIGEKFDLVVFAGTLYHLKNPFAVIEDIAKVCTDTVILETEVISPNDESVIYCRLGPPGNVATRPAHSGFMKFIESTELNGDPSNWWVPDTECVKAMLRASGFNCFSTPLYPSEGRLVLVATKRKESLATLENIG
jgi:tRNA (mo5U34)-methyltransferase